VKRCISSAGAEKILNIYGNIRANAVEGYDVTGHFLSLPQPMSVTSCLSGKSRRKKCSLRPLLCAFLLFWDQELHVGPSTEGHPAKQGRGYNEWVEDPTEIIWNKKIDNTIVVLYNSFIIKE
jgi:hypothetical protein